MLSNDNGEDVRSWLGTSIDLHRGGEDAGAEPAPHRADEVRRALDRLYRRRQLGPDQPLR